MKTIQTLVLLAGFVLAAPALSQTMYKCGRVYQDRPCDDGSKGKAMGAATSSAPAPAAGAGPYEAECAQRGRDSLKVVWAREGGATLDRLLSEAKSGAERRLIQDVYRRPGAASQVQVAVHADCIAEKQKLEQDAALAAAAAVKAQREGTLPAVPSGAPAGARPAGDPVESEARRQERLAADDARRKKETCDRLGRDSERLRNRERAGGTSRDMERLANERRELNSEMSRAGCR